MKKCSTYLYLLPILCLTIVFLYGQGVINLKNVYGFTMSGDNYILEMGNLNSIAGSAQGTEKKLNFTSGGQTSPGTSTGSNNKIKAGFQFIHPFRGFSFAISNPLIDFGILSPTNPVTRNTILTVQNRSTFGYTVLASENHMLKTTNGQIIPDTTCDDGQCNDVRGSVWTSTLTYGFGYRCDNVTGEDCPSEFATADLYKQFADASKGETGKSVMEAKAPGNIRSSKITYKVNIPGTQTPGSYANTITYIAAPTF